MNNDKVYTAQTRNNPIVIDGNSITIAQDYTKEIPFFFGRLDSLVSPLKSGYLTSFQGETYKLSYHERVQIKKSKKLSQSKPISISAPTQGMNIDTWFIHRIDNLIFVDGSYDLSKKTINVFLHFGAVKSDKGNFQFKSINKAQLAYEHAIANRKLSPMIENKEGRPDFSHIYSDKSKLKGKNILLVQPNELNGVISLGKLTNTDFVSNEKLTPTFLENQGLVHRGISVYEIPEQCTYDEVIFHAHTENELIELFNVLIQMCNVNLMISIPENIRIKSHFINFVIEHTAILNETINNHKVLIIRKGLFNNLDMESFKTKVFKKTL